MAAADQQGQARLGQRTVLELVDRDVRGEVVDAVQRLAQPEGQRLGGGHPDQQRAGQARAAGHRDRVDVVQPDPGGLAGPLDGRHHRLEVGPAGDLGYDAAEPGVLVDAAGDRVGQQRVAADDADAGLVAGGLDAEHQRAVAHAGHHARSPGSAAVGWSCASPRPCRRRGSSAAAGRSRRSRGRRRTRWRRRCPRAPRAASGPPPRVRASRRPPPGARSPARARRCAGSTAIRCSSAMSATTLTTAWPTTTSPSLGHEVADRRQLARDALLDQARGPRVVARGSSRSSAAIAATSSAGGRAGSRGGLARPGRRGVRPAQVERLRVPQLGPLLGHRAGQPAGAGPRRSDRRAGRRPDRAARPRPRPARRSAGSPACRPPGRPAACRPRRTTPGRPPCGGRRSPPRSRPRPPGVDRLQREHVERADAVHRDLEDEPSVRAVTRPTRSPVNGPGPTPTAIAVRSCRTMPALGHRPLDQRGQLLAVLHPLLRRVLDHDVLAVVQRDRDQRGGGVEGEQHAAEATATRRHARSGPGLATADARTATGRRTPPIPDNSREGSSTADCG